MTKKQMYEERPELFSSYSFDEVLQLPKRSVEGIFNGTGFNSSDNPDELQTQDPTINELSNESDIHNALSDDLSSYQEENEITFPTTSMPQEEAKPKRKSKVKGKTIISGYMLLLILDIVCPQIISLVYNKVTGKTIANNQLSLQPEQREDLGDLAEEAAKTLAFEVNPIWLFSISLLTMYATNFIVATGGIGSLFNKN